MKTKLIVWGLLIGLATVAGLGARYIETSKNGNGDLELYGNVDVRQVDLAFKVSGRLGEVRFEEGDAVKQGIVVASLENADFKDEVELARAGVQAREALLAKLESGTRIEEIEQAKATLDARRTALILAEATLRRVAALAEKDFTSHQSHDQAQAQRDEAAAAVAVAEKALQLAQSGARKEDIQAARAQLAAQQAKLNLARRRLADTDLIAPNDGTILTRVREPGAIVSAGQTIYMLSLATPVWVRTYATEPDLGRIRPGMPAEVRTDSGGIYQGQIGFISPVAEFTPKSVETRKLRTSLVYRLRVIVANPDSGLRQGMPVTVTLKTGAQG